MKGLRNFVRQRQMRKLKPWVLPFSVVLALVLLLGSTFAWFIAADGINNRVKTAPKGNFGVDVVDEFERDPDGPTKPGDEFMKRVGAVNTQSINAFVRLLVIPTFVMDDGTVMPARFGDQVLIADLNADLDPAVLTAGNDWIYNPTDGYFYYKHVLQPGLDKSTDVLGKNLFGNSTNLNVKVATDLPAEYIGATLKIEVKSEAVDIQKWHYREGWWGSSAAPLDPNGAAIDHELRTLATG